MDKQTQDVTELYPEITPSLIPNIRANKNIPIEAIIELRQKNLTVNQIAKILGCDHSNIVRRLQSISNEIDLTHSYKKNRADILAFHQRRIIQSITPADLKKAGLRDKIISAGVLYDKERLETGQSTQNIFYADMIKAKSQVDKEIQELEGQNVECSDTKG